MTLRHGLLFCYLLLAIGVSPLLGREQQAARSANQVATRVYVGGFDGHLPTSQSRDLGRSFATLLTLRLAQINSLRIIPLEQMPVCGLQPAQAPEKGQVAPREPSATEQGPVFFSAGGSVMLSKTDEEHGQTFILDYKLVKWQKCRPTNLLHSLRPFSQWNAFTAFTQAADELAFKLSDEVRPPQGTWVDVAEIVGGKDPEEKAIADELTRFLLLELAQGGVVPRDLRTHKTTPPAQYRIETELQFEGKSYLQRSPYLIFPTKRSSLRRVRAIITLVDSKRETTYKAVPVEAAVGQGREGSKALDKFYRSAAKAALDKLNDRRFADEANLPSLLSTTEPQVKFRRAQELLCLAPQTSAKCQASPNKAIPLLQSLAADKNSASDPAVFDLLGRSLSAVGEYRDAALNFDQARALVSEGDPAKVIVLLNQAGDAWYSAGDYRGAAERYEESLRTAGKYEASLPPSLRQLLPEIRLRRAHSLRLAGERMAALDALLGSLRISPGSKELGAELEQVVGDLTGDELGAAVKLLDASRNLIPGTAALALAHTRLGEALYRAAMTKEQMRAAKTELESGLELKSSDPVVLVNAHGYLAAIAYSEGDFTTMDEQLKVAEGLRTPSISNAIREWLLRLRALWYRDNGGKNFAQAEKLLKEGMQVMPGEAPRLELGETYFEWAQSLGQDQVRANSLYGNANQYLTSLVEERYTRADFLLRETNHMLGKDEATRQMFEQIIARNPRDLSALQSVMFLCTEYLYDFRCALDKAHLVEKAGVPPDAPSLELDIAEIETLSGSYEEATNHLDHVLSGVNLDVRFQAVGRFYQVWVALLRKRADEATRGLRQWQGAVQRLREDKDKTAVGWVFGGARHALETDQPFAATSKKLLLDMISAMEDTKQPLPHAISRDSAAMPDWSQTTQGCSGVLQAA